MSLQATRARLVASPVVTGKSSQPLWRACSEQTYLIYGIKLLYVIRPAENPETLYILILVSDEIYSVVLKRMGSCCFDLK